MSEGAATKTLLGTIVVSGVTTFMFYPLITLELLQRGQSTLAAGVILGLLSGVGPVSSVFIGQVNARWGSKRMVVLGLLFRSLGLSVFAFENSFAVYALGAVLASLSSGCLSLALKTELMRSSTSRRMITLRSIMVNFGALVGPSLGGVLYFLTDFSTVVGVAIGSYLVLAVVLLNVHFQPPEQSTTKQAASLSLSDLSSEFMLLCLCVLGYWTIYALWPLVVPIVAVEGFGTPVASGWVYSGNAVLILTLQYWLVVKRLSNISSTDLLGFGFFLCITGFAALLLPSGPLVVVVFATAFSFGEMFISPILDELTGRVDTGRLGLTRSYGITGSIGGIGSLLGAPLGGLLIDLTGSVSGALALVIPTAMVGMVSAAHLRKRESLA